MLKTHKFHLIKEMTVKRDYIRDALHGDLILRPPMTGYILLTGGYQMSLQEAKLLRDELTLALGMYTDDR